MVNESSGMSHGTVFQSDCKDTKFLIDFQIFRQLFLIFFSVLTIHFLHFHGLKLSPKGDKKYSQ